VGAYFIIVNPAKRQYFDPAILGEPIKFYSFLRGEHALFILKLLISDHFHHTDHAFPGVWLGDPVIFASDDAGIPDPGGFTTATPDDTSRNLHALATAEYANITYRAIAELCKNHGMAAEIALNAKAAPHMLIDLAAVQDQYQVPELEWALNEAVGKPWRKAHNEVLKTAYRSPLPPIDSPL